MNVYRYEEVRIMQVDYLASVRFGVDDKTTKRLCEKIDKKIDAYASGDLEYAGEAMSLLWEVSRKHGNPWTPSSPRPQSILPAALTPENRKRVRIALIKSIREGVFVDRKYWAQRSRAGQVLQPVYFSSIVAGQMLPYIDNRKRLDPA